MRILFISPFLYRYSRGIERYTVELANALSAKGIEVHLLTWEGNRPWSWGKLAPLVFLHTAKLPRYFQAFWAGLFYKKKILEIKPDVINVFFSWHGEGLALRFLGFTVLYNLILHYPAGQITHRYRQLQKTPIPSKADKIIAVSQHVKAGAEEWFGREALIVPSGVDTDKFKPAEQKSILRKKMNFSESATLLFTAAALEERKNIDKAIDAMPLILKKTPDLLFLIAGEGPKRKQLEEQVDRLGLRKNVQFLGAVSNPADFYQISDLFLFLSQGEAGPLAMLEAMAAGLPVVAARQPPLEEYIGPRAALLVNEKEPSEIAAAVENLLKRDPLEMIEDSNHNRVYAESRFGWSSIADQFIEIFNLQCSRTV